MKKRWKSSGQPLKTVSISAAQPTSRSWRGTTLGAESGHGSCSPRVGDCQVMAFSDFDSRGYRIVDVRSGYGEWVTTYEQTVQDAMDIDLLRTLRHVSWA